MNAELKKALAPWLKLADESRALTLRGVKSLESLAADIHWQRVRMEGQDRRQAARDRSYARKEARRIARWRRKASKAKPAAASASGSTKAKSRPMGSSPRKGGAR